MSVSNAVLRFSGYLNNRVFQFLYSPRRRHQIIGYTALIIVWEIYGRMSSFLALAPFSEFVVAFVDLYLSGDIYGPIITSAQAAAGGYFLAIVVALPLGLALGASDTVKHLLEQYVNVMFVTSVSSLLPLLILIFGIGFMFKIAVVFLFCIFHMIYNFQAGVEDINKELLDAGEVYGADGIGLYRYVVLPAALPFIIAGLRLGIGRSWRGMVVAELWIVSGIGELLRGFQHSHQTDSVMALIFTLMIFGVVSVKLLYFAQRKLAPWKSV